MPKTNSIYAIIKKQRNYKLIVFLFNGLFKRLCKYKVINSELLPKDNGFVLVMNHRDYWDIPLVFSLMGTRPVHALVKNELKKEIAGKVLRIMGAVFVDRNDVHSRKFSKEALTEIVSSGSNVLICPEGTRNKTNSVLLPFAGHGAVSIAQKTGRPIVPVAISTFEEMGRRKLVKICPQLTVDMDEDLSVANDRLYSCLRGALLKNKEHTGGYDGEYRN